MKRIITAIPAAILVASAQTKGEAERMLKAAQNAEVVDGDLKAAIEQYDEIVTKFEKTNRSITASALVRMAGCYTKLGDTESRKIYERVLRDYADQTEAAAVARARLGNTEPSAPANGDRVVWSGEDIEHVGGSVSRDGRFISYTDWWSTGNLMLHDLASGTDRPLTGNKDWGGEGSALSSAFSRDGTEVAYGWINYDPGRTEIRVVNIERTGIPEARRIFESEDVTRMDAIDWSPDGKWLAVHLVRKNSGGEISLVGEDGSQRVLRSVGWRGPKKIFFSPDSKCIAYDLPVSDEAVQRDVYVAAVDGSGEAQAVAHAAHGLTMGWSPDGKQLLFASDRTGSVALWALPVEDGKPQGAPSMLKLDIGSVSSLGLADSGSLHIYKDTSTIALHIAPIDLEVGRVTGPPVVESYRSHRPDWSRDGKYLAYKSSDVSGVNLLSIRNLETGELRSFPIAFSYFSEPRWSPDGSWLVAGARDFKGNSAIYRFDAETGAVSMIAPGRHVARVSVSPDGGKIWKTLTYTHHTHTFSSFQRTARCWTPAFTTRTVSPPSRVKTRSRMLARIFPSRIF